MQAIARLIVRLTGYLIVNNATLAVNGPTSHVATVKFGVQDLEGFKHMVWVPFALPWGLSACIQVKAFAILTWGVDIDWTEHSKTAFALDWTDFKVGEWMDDLTYMKYLVFVLYKKTKTREWREMERDHCEEEHTSQG